MCLAPHNAFKQHAEVHNHMLYEMNLFHFTDNLHREKTP